MKLKYTKFQKAIELITLIFLFTIWVYLILSWDKLPNKIPGHYNGSGVVDRFGSKNEILITPIFSFVLYTLLTIVSFFPSIWNVPYKVTEEGREFTYLHLKTMLILIKMEMVITFSYMTYCSIKIQALGAWFLPLELIIIFGTIIYYVIKVYRKKDKMGI
jgi:uncharacterized membrane protein